MAFSRKRDADARRTFRMPRAPYIAGSLAVLATLATVGVGVVAADPDTRDVLVSSNRASVERVADPAPVERPQVVSRSQERIIPEEPWEDMLEKKAVAQAVRAADTRRWTSAALNLWTNPGKDAAKKGLLPEARKVLVTGRRAAGRTEVVIGGTARWVTAGYLTEVNPNADTTPAPSASRNGRTGGGGADESAAPSLGGECTNGTAVDGQPNVIAVHQAVCAAFPDIATYGTYRSDGEHAQGLAIDIMVSGSRGWEVAEFVRANSSGLGVSYVMYSQKIWSVDRSGEGWRYVEDRGSATANHFDHVHVTTY